MLGSEVKEERPQNGNVGDPLPGGEGWMRTCLKQKQPVLPTPVKMNSREQVR